MCVNPTPHWCCADLPQVPAQASWQDLKDLFRQAGDVIRADVGMTMDGRPKGNGTVVFVNPESARQAIGKPNIVILLAWLTLHRAVQRL